MSKFETGNDIVRVGGFANYAPRGYKARVLEGYQFRDNHGVLTPIVDKYWKRAEVKSPAIKTDNSTVITSLNDRIAELEGYNVGLADESCTQQIRITELKKDLESCLVMIESFYKNTGSLGAKSLAGKIRGKALKESKS